MIKIDSIDETILNNYLKYKNKKDKPAWFDRAEKYLVAAGFINLAAPLS